MRRPPTTPGASNLRPKKSIRRPLAKKARVLGPRESQIPAGMTPEGIIKRPMVTQPPIEGNLDYELGHSTLSYVLI